MSRTFENRYFKKVAEQTSDAIVIADRAGRITWTNPAFVKLCGYERREVLGKKPGSFLQGKQTDRKTAHNVKEAIRKRTPRSRQRYSTIIKMITPTGYTFPSTRCTMPTVSQLVLSQWNATSHLRCSSAVEPKRNLVQFTEH